MLTQSLWEDVPGWVEGMLGGGPWGESWLCCSWGTTASLTLSLFFCEMGLTTLNAQGKEVMSALLYDCCYGWVGFISLDEIVGFASHEALCRDC